MRSSYRQKTGSPVERRIPRVTWYVALLCFISSTIQVKFSVSNQFGDILLGERYNFEVKSATLGCDIL